MKFDIQRLYKISITMSDTVNSVVTVSYCVCAFVSVHFVEKLSPLNIYYIHKEEYEHLILHTVCIQFC